MGDAGTGASIIAALVGEDYAYFTAFLFGALVIAFLQGISSTGRPTRARGN